jgi:hypothetical protein
VDIAGDVEGAEDIWVCCCASCGMAFGSCFSGELTPDDVVFGELTPAVPIGVEPGGIGCVVEGEALPE